MTVIEKAQELVATQGKEAAKKYFIDKITEMGEPKNFLDLCKIYGWSIAIKHIDLL